MRSPLPPQAASHMTESMAYRSVSGNEFLGVRAGWGLTMCRGVGENGDAQREARSSARCCPCDGLILVIGINLGMRGWRDTQPKEIWAFGWKAT